MTGESYYGYTHWAVAPLGHPNLRCIATGDTAADINGSWVYVDNCFCMQTMGQWAHQMQGSHPNPSTTATSLSWHRPSEPCRPKGEASCYSILCKMMGLAQAFDMDLEPVAYGYSLFAVAGLHVMQAFPNVSYFELVYPVEPWARRREPRAARCGRDGEGAGRQWTRRRHRLGHDRGDDQPQDQPRPRVRSCLSGCRGQGRGLRMFVELSLQTRLTRQRSAWLAPGLTEAPFLGGSYPQGRETARDGKTDEVRTGVPTAECAHRPRVAASDRRGSA